ncbi:MAG: Trk family potassium uptake protein, partial [Peptococcaceae bacterium]|nr:Trk family potassium uptake protein [Peptococcaceae bacterium]
GKAPFFDALFTAVSASCVTGLIVQDTATYWSFFGQAVILLLIQIGGLGVITTAMVFTRLSRRTISLKQRSILQDAITAPQVGGIVRLTSFIVKTSIIIELLGAILLAPVFCSEFGMLRGIWYALFHSVSAFCNAGFDLMGSYAPYASLTMFSASPYMLSIIMCLIVIGGIGFLTWEDIRVHKHHLRRYTMQSKTILSCAMLLIIGPALYFFCFELSDLPLAKRCQNALFQAVTTRTAGFNTVVLSKFSETGFLIIIILMLIGGAPGSTAGGMKTTTCAVLFGTLVSVLRQKKDTQLFRRRIAAHTVRTAFSVACFYFLLCIVSGSIICQIEHLPLLYCLFETASALGTVGLSLGITHELSAVSKCILIILMYIGRVGSLTLIFSAASKKSAYNTTLPQEQITIG